MTGNQFQKNCSHLYVIFVFCRFIHFKNFQIHLLDHWNWNQFQSLCHFQSLDFVIVTSAWIGLNKQSYPFNLCIDQDSYPKEHLRFLHQTEANYCDNNCLSLFKSWIHRILLAAPNFRSLKLLIDETIYLIVVVQFVCSIKNYP